MGEAPSSKRAGGATGALGTGHRGPARRYFSERLVQPAVAWGRRAVMPMDAYRSGDEFVVSIDLPGIDPSSIELTVEKNVLTVKAERTWQRGEGEEVLVSERPHGSFSRQLFLGEGLDSERIEAVYDNGVLTLRVPVAEQAKARKVEITTGARQGALDAPSVAA